MTRLSACLVLVAALSFGGCRKKHVEVASVPQLPYPSCPAGEGMRETALGEGALRPGQTSLEQMVTERFSFRARGCLRVLTSRQEWPLNVSDIEVVYDAAGLPLRAWKRMSLPGAPNAASLVDIRRYEMRTPEVTITRRVGAGPRRYEVLRGGRPTAVLGPGRGILTAWLQRARLAVGGRTRELALDMRETVELIRPVTLRREADMHVAAIGRVVRVYTVYGRESVYADEHDVVLGDLAGMLPDAVVHTPRPPAMVSPEPADPVNTP